MEMHSRRQAREAALQALYGCDLLAQWDLETVDGYFYAHHTADLAQLEGEPEYLFARKLIEGVLKFRLEIDRQIEMASDNWKLSRMAFVDRNILRVAAFELHLLVEAPFEVVINEALEIAKVYGGPESPSFINGVLNRLASLNQQAQLCD